MMKCCNCGNEIDEKSQFCRFCGKEITKKEDIKDPRSNNEKSFLSDSLKDILKCRFVQFFYALWVSLNSILLLINGHYFTSDNGRLWHNDEIGYFYPDFDEYFDHQYHSYDETEWLVYCIVLPIILVLIFLGIKYVVSEIQHKNYTNIISLAVAVCCMCNILPIPNGCTTFIRCLAIIVAIIWSRRLWEKEKILSMLVLVEAIVVLILISSELKIISLLNDIFLASGIIVLVAKELKNKHKQLD